MRYCLNCRHITVGEPLFCNFCGRSYNSKLCPARHVNPRNAEICSQCGSRDLSTPAPHTPLWVIPTLWLVKKLPGVVLLLVSVLFFIGVVRAILTDPQVQGSFLAAGLVLGLAWYLYMQLPASIRRLFHHTSGKRSKTRSDH